MELETKKRIGLVTQFVIFWLPAGLVALVIYHALKERKEKDNG